MADEAEVTALLESLVVEILSAFFDLRAAGKEYGLVTEQGAGSWGLLRMLRDQGPMTMPEVARSRSVSRQYIQKLASELIAEGWIGLRDNPAHKRSKLMYLTKSGEQELVRMTQRLRAVLVELAPDFSARNVKSAVATVAKLRTHLQ